VQASRQSGSSDGGDPALLKRFGRLIWLSATRHRDTGPTTLMADASRGRAKDYSHLACSQGNVTECATPQPSSLKISLGAPCPYLADDGPGPTRPLSDGFDDRNRLRLCRLSRNPGRIAIFPWTLKGSIPREPK